MLRSGNPALTDKTFSDAQLAGGEERMTIQGTVNKTGLTLVITIISASWVWMKFFQGQQVMPLLLVGAIGGFVVALVTVFKKTAAPFTTPLYGALEGMALGAISATYEVRFPGIVMNAVGLTFGVLFALLAAYKSRLIPVTENFKLGVAAATGGVAILYLASFVLSFFGIRIPFIHESGLIGIIFSLAVVVIASLNLVMDFDFIEKGAEQNSPKYMEWYGAFGLVVTLVWLYLEMLRLLSKLQKR